jgi:hypothetical protein
MSITTQDSLIAGLRPPVPFCKTSVTSKGAGAFHSLWQAAGLPGAGVTPPAFNAGSGYVPDRTTAGALPFTNPTAGALSYLAGIGASGAVAGTFWLYDRCWACSGFVTNITTAQTITTPGNVGRYQTFDGVEIWGECYVPPGATGANWTVSYTNQAGTSGRTATYVHPASAEVAGQMLPFTLQAGDTGVQSVQSFTCSISSGTAGNIGITLVRRAKLLPLVVPNVGAVLDAIGCGMPRLLDDVCLSLMVLCTAATTGTIAGEVLVAQG